MLGVIAIHAGSSIMLSSTPNVYLYMLFEVLSRFSVPAFFFISGYGLFASYDLQQRLAYFPYVLKRLKSVGLPYMIWSLLYLLYYEKISPGSVDWSISGLCFTFFFGLACYHIYFMVILLWFYILFPLWRSMLRLMHNISLSFSLVVLFFLQIGVNYWTSHFWTYPAWLANNAIALNLLNYRLNYLPFHYLFIFFMGALAALHYEAFIALLRVRFRSITAFFFVTVAIMSSRFYYLLNVKKWDLESISNTLQQLSPEGFLYTISSLFFFCAVLQRMNGKNILLKVINLLAVNSYIIYLIHPFFLDQIAWQLNRFGLPMDSVPALIYYFLIILCSLVASLLLKKLGKVIPILSLLLTGKKR